MRLVTFNGIVILSSLLLGVLAAACVAYFYGWKLGLITSVIGIPLFVLTVSLFLRNPSNPKPASERKRKKAIALAMSGDAGGIDVLREITRENSLVGWKNNAIRALIRLQTPDAVAILVETVKKSAPGTLDHEVDGEMLTFLAGVGSRESILAVASLMHRDFRVRDYLGNERRIKWGVIDSAETKAAREALVMHANRSQQIFVDVLKGGRAFAGVPTPDEYDALFALAAMGDAHCLATLMNLSPGGMTREGRGFQHLIQDTIVMILNRCGSACPRDLLERFAAREDLKARYSGNLQIGDTYDMSFAPMREAAAQELRKLP